jgi:RNA polymerase sigma-70 factor (ECF subfamily)
MARPRAEPTRDHATTPASDDPFTALYRAEVGYVWRTLRRLGVRARDLPDLTHEVFVIVYRRMHDYDHDRPRRPWLFGIAFREASHYHRRAGHGRELVADEVRVLDEAPGAEELMARAQDQALVAEAVATLDLERRAALVMHDFDRHPVADIAAAMGVPVKTVYSRLRVAREQFVATVRRLQRQRGER